MDQGYWRVCSYSRDDKRYQEKKNRAQRAQLKKEDNARLRKLVDVCLSVDPRIAEFRAAEKKQRNAKKDAKAAAAKAAAEEAAQKAKEEKLAAKKAAEDAKAAAAAAKKSKEAAKKNIRKEKKNIKTIVQENNYAVAGTASPDDINKQLLKLDEVLEKNKDLEQLKKMRTDFEKAVADGKLPEVFASYAN